MKKATSIILLLALFSALTLPCLSVQVIGQVLSTDIRAYINGAEIPAYNIDGKLAVVISDLNNYGFKTSYNNNLRKASVTRNASATSFTSVPSKASGLPIGAHVMDVYQSDIIVELDGQLVQAFNVDNHMAIFFRELQVYGRLSYDNDSRTSSLVLSDYAPQPPHNDSAHEGFYHLVKALQEHGMSENEFISYLVYSDTWDNNLFKSHTTNYIIYDPSSNLIIVEVNVSTKSNSSLGSSGTKTTRLFIPSDVPSSLEITYVDENGILYKGEIIKESFSGLSGDIKYWGDVPQYDNVAHDIAYALRHIDESYWMYHAGADRASGVRSLGFASIGSLRELAKIFEFQLDAESYVTSEEMYDIPSHSYMLRIRNASWNPKSHMLTIGFYNVETGKASGYDFKLDEIDDDIGFKLHSNALPSGYYKIFVCNYETTPVAGSIQYWLEEEN